ncbi:CoA pyrophosphatase [Brachybacterium sp. EF45031]|nr:CoA pyrophosphatase [Brachybacterium sillae]
MNPLRPVPEGFSPRRSAVLALLAGTDDPALLLQERSATLRSQPGQFALPGGRHEDSDRDDVETALRESAEEVGLRAGDVEVLGAFAPVPMPWRDLTVTPVVAWSPVRPPVRVVDEAEVARVVWAPLAGPGSLTDPACRVPALLDGRAAGLALDLPGDAFVWGFTAAMVDALLHRGEQPPPPPRGPAREVPSARR